MDRDEGPPPTPEPVSGASRPPEGGPPPESSQIAEGSQLPRGSQLPEGSRIPDEGRPSGRDGPSAPPPVPPRPPRSSLFEVGVVVIVALLLALLLKVYVAEAYEIHGRSMEDTFHDCERVMVLKAFYEIQRGDIIIFSSSENPQKDLIKRVIGLPGDTVEVNGSDVLVNGVKLKEPYARPNTRVPREHRYRKVESGKYYVLGDNRPDSQDSRVFDLIDGSSIKGKVKLRWWPLEKLRSF